MDACHLHSYPSTPTLGRKEHEVGATEKTSVAIGRDELAWARERAERDGTSLSAVVTEAIRRRKQLEAWVELRDALLGGQEPISLAEARAMEAELFPPKERRRAKRSAAKKRRR
jgi:hypothetical protein